MPPSWPFWETKEAEPPIDQAEPSQFEEWLLEVAEENLDRVAIEWSQRDRDLHAACSRAVENYMSAQGLLERASDVQKKAIEEYEVARERYRTFPHPQMSGLFFWLMFAVMTFAEFAFNILVFSVFGQSQTHTLLMAAGLMIAIPWLSHFIGEGLRVERKSPVTIALMIVSALSIIILLVVIAVLREKFFEASKVAEALGLQWDSRNILFTFFIVNIALFVAMVILSYQVTPRDPEGYKRAKRDFEEANKRLQREAGDLKDAARMLAAARENMNAAHYTRFHEWEKYRYLAEEERDIWVRMIKSYRYANMSARKDKTRPASFSLDPEGRIQMPGVLTELRCEGCAYSMLRGDQG